jgi:predicted transcriptional regulator
MDNKTITMLIVWVKDGEYRLKVLKNLEKENLLPSEIAAKINTHRSCTSRILKDLHDKDLVTYTESGSRTRLYNISEKGKLILKML